MNKRIKELKIQACKWASENVSATEYENACDLKFAELIVGECVNLCYDRAYRGTLGSFTDGAMLCANDIKEHFGVEE